MTEQEPWWKKHITFEWSDSVVDEILHPDFNEAISIGEAKELARDFNTLKQKFRNLIGLLDATDTVLDEYLDKINNYSDEELLAWRKARNDEIRETEELIRKIFEDDNESSDCQEDSSHG